MDVSESDDGLTLTIKTDKRVNPFQIYRPEDGFAMFKIRYEGSNSPVPDELSGSYTSRKSAFDHLSYWLEHSKPTKEKEWEDKYKDTPTPTLKVKANAAKVQSEGN